MWTERVRDAMSRYDEALLRTVAGRLFKPRIGQPLEELSEKSAETQSNPPVIDRRIRDLPEAARTLLVHIGLSHQLRWKVAHLILLSASAGHPDGFNPVHTLLESGILFPDTKEPTVVSNFGEWLGIAGTLTAQVFVHPIVATRARGFITRGAAVPGSADSAAVRTTVADGLEWPLRFAAIWQQVRALPVRMTQSSALFKRDQTRLQGDPSLNAPFADLATPVVDAGLLGFEWATALGLFEQRDIERFAAPFPASWSAGIWPALVEVYAAFFGVESWDPLVGHRIIENGVSATPTAALIAFGMLAESPANKWIAPRDIANKLWEHHPTWQGALTKESQKAQGSSWVEALLLSVAYPLHIVETRNVDGFSFRLTDFGWHLLCGQPEPATPSSFQQTLVVQPNAEVLAYRQGLTLALIAKLSGFAAWKLIGAACTLELNAEETYRGLESGLSLAEMTQTLDRHGAKPVPANVADLLRRWADKRDRVTIFASATLVEFGSAADLDTALNKGIIAIRLTDRIGLTADGNDPDFKSLRLIGNRDYDAKAIRCVVVADDGVTLTIDAGQSDLLLEAEIVRLAEPVLGDQPGLRRFRVTPESLRRGAAQGMSVEDFDRWFQTRTGLPLPAAGRLFLQGASQPPATVQQLLVLQVAASEIADGIEQWPETRRLTIERLGPTSFAVSPTFLKPLEEKLKLLGIILASESTSSEIVT